MLTHGCLLIRNYFVYKKRKEKKKEKKEHHKLSQEQLNQTWACLYSFSLFCMLIPNFESFEHFLKKMLTLTRGTILLSGRAEWIDSNLILCLMLQNRRYLNVLRSFLQCNSFESLKVSY